MKIASITTAMVASALLAFACTTTTEPATDSETKADAGSGSTDESTDESTDAGSDARTVARSDAGSDAGSSVACADETYLETCEQCCGKDNPKGYQDYNNAFATCVCKPENCASECAATICASPDNAPDNACADCYTASRVLTPCAVQLEACKESPDCVAFEQCRTSNCQNKPSKP